MVAIVLCASRAALAEPLALPTEWKPWNSHHYRLEADGHLSCYRENKNKSSCSINAPDPAKAQPLKCNDPRWGGKNRKRTGYEVPGHWCNKAFAVLFTEWRVHPYQDQKIELAVLPSGDIMCRSMDSTTCQAAGTATPGGPVDPLVCGRAHKKRHQFTGYEAQHAEHWCQTPFEEVVFNDIKPTAKHTGREEDVFKLQRQPPKEGEKRGKSVPVKVGSVERHAWTFEGVTPGWGPGDQVDWILEFNAAQADGRMGSRPEVTFEVSGGAWSATMRQDAKTGFLGVRGAEDDILLPADKDNIIGSDGRFALGIRIDGGSRVRYFATAGDVEQLFAPEHEIMDQPDSMLADIRQITHRQRPGAVGQGRVSVMYKPAYGESASEHTIERVKMIRRAPARRAAAGTTP
ncbi:hypothetical protein ACNI65_16020 [Roseateles sp. So40a]|uniref:hypothetical protein n=1 Tax=Roseateles sp. So40a TaxID=3400226 RepID=UPI003A898E7B